MPLFLSQLLSFLVEDYLDYRRSPSAAVGVFELAFKLLS